MNTYAYRIYKTLNNPVIGGTVHAQDMESAAKKIIAENGIEVIHKMDYFRPEHYFMRNGQKVGILIYLNPEEF